MRLGLLVQIHECKLVVISHLENLTHRCGCFLLVVIGLVAQSLVAAKFTCASGAERKDLFGYTLSNMEMLQENRAHATLRGKVGGKD